MPVLTGLRLNRLPETSAVAGQLSQQFRRPDQSALIDVHAVDQRGDLRQAETVRPVHGAAAMGGEAVAVNPDHVDVAGARGDALFKKKRAFVDQRAEAALDDLRPSMALM